MTEIQKSLYRLPKQGNIFGVCAGLAEYFAIDVTLIRIVFVVLTFVTDGMMVVLYVILALILPTPKEFSNSKKSKVDEEDSIGERFQKLGQEMHAKNVVKRTRNYLGGGLLVIGFWLLIGQVFPGWFELRWDFVWPILIILTGLLIVIRRNDG